MPLSEHEQRLLDQIERALYQEDPKFASTVKSTDLRTHMRRRLRRAAFVLVLGFGILLAGTAWKRLQPGGADLHGVDAPDRPARGGGSGPGRSSKPRKQSSGSSGGMKDKLEERWKRRWEERGGER